MDGGDQAGQQDARELQEGAAGLVNYLSRHLVCLGINWAPLGPGGRPSGPARFAAYPGFVVDFHGHWLLITAGHNLGEQIDDNVAAGNIRIVTSSLADFFGPGAKVFRPTPIDYENTPRFSIDDRDFGLDVGVMYLRPLLRQGLEANGIAPIEEANWVSQGRVDIQAFGVLGFPSRCVESYRRTGEFGEESVGTVQATFISVKRLEAMPDGMQGSDLPYFVGQVNPNVDMGWLPGMSGGPIFGLHATPSGELRYWVVAVQSRMDRQRRVVLGCPVPVFMDLFESSFQEFAEENGLPT
jgi:hypothetical protein